MTALPRPCLCLVTDRRAAAPGAKALRDELLELQHQLDEAMAAGIDLIQIRERDLEAATLCALAADLVRRAPVGTRICVNDRADVALAAGAAGVHLRADGPPASRVRSLGPAGWMVGRSTHQTDEVEGAIDADYVIFGTVFASRSKGRDAAVAGVGRLRAACERTAVPVLAIGGITPERVAACRDAGAAGVAAIGVFLPHGRSPDALGPAEAIRSLRERWREGT